MTLEQYRRQWLRHHRIYERRAYLILRRTLINAIKNINLSDANKDNYAAIITTGLKLERANIQKGYIELYKSIGLLHGKRVLQGIEKETKNLFTDNFERNLIQFIVNYGGNRIVSVSETLAQWLVNEIGLRNLEGKSVSQIVTEIIRQRRFYRSQLMRIARTETTAAAGYASNAASSTTGLVLEKIWVSAQDPRTRVVPEDSFDHLNMHKVKVDDNKPFQVPNKNGGIELLQFPGDPSGSAGNVINCRCTVIKMPKRDDNGNLIRKF